MKTPLHISQGCITAVAYRDEVLRPIVAPTIQIDTLPQRFQHDNARAHTARVSTTFLQQKNINVLPWPCHQTYPPCVGYSVAESKTTPSTASGAAAT